MIACLEVYIMIHYGHAAVHVLTEPPGDQDFEVHYVVDAGNCADILTRLWKLLRGVTFVGTDYARACIVAGHLSQSVVPYLK